MDESVPPAIPRRSLLARISLAGAAIGAVSQMGCSPIAALNALAPSRLAQSGISYASGPRRRLDVYRPTGPGPFPVVVFIYGGAWDSGDRSMYRFVGGTLAARGFVTVIPDYRLYPEVRYPEFLEDCAEALAWTHANIGSHGGAAGPLWLMGHSAGAYNAAMLALDPQWLQQVGMSSERDLLGTVGLAGPYDFLPLDTDQLRAIFAPAVPLSTSQPIGYVDGKAAPMLLLAGSADRTVDPGNSSRLASRIRAAGGTVETRLYPGVDHREIIGAFSAPLRFLAPSLRDSLTFMHAGSLAG